MFPPKLVEDSCRDWTILLDCLSAEMKDKPIDTADEYAAIIQIYSIRGIREIFEKWLSTLLPDKSVLEKCASRAISWRERGNVYFKEGKLEQSLECYTFSVLSAPREHLTFPLALANRAAVLLKMARYKECVRDAELALSQGYPRDERANKLLRRLQLAREHVPVQKDDVLSTPLFTPHPTLDGASSALDVKYSDKYGRYIVTNREVQEGEILFLEDPYAFVALPGPDGVLPTACEMCCAPDICPVPCVECAGSVYCSEECRERAWENFHRWECSGTRSLLWPTIGIAHLALRTYLVGRREGFGLGEEETGGGGALLQHLREAALTPPAGRTYLRIYNLVTNFTKMDKQDFLQYALTSVMLATYLERRSGLAGGGGPAGAALLLRHLGQLVSCGHAVGSAGRPRRATAIYPSVSIMNHACAPAVRSAHRSARLAVRAAARLSCGVEVTNCYGPHYRRMTGARRREALLRQYAFLCDCSACSDPLKDSFADLFDCYLCDMCRGPVFTSNYECEDCGRIVPDPDELQHSAETSLQLYRHAQTLEGREAIRTTLRVKTLQEKIFHKYNTHLRKTNDLLANLLAAEGRYEESAALVEAALDAVRLQFGATSAEVAHELHKLGGVLLERLRADLEPNSGTLRAERQTAERVLSEALRIFRLIYDADMPPHKDALDQLQSVKNLAINDLGE